MEVIIIKVVQFFAALSLLVLIHEFGHFIAARIFGIRVEKFYIFFNPWFSLWKRKIGDTECFRRQYSHSTCSVHKPL